ncbi:MAG: YhfZ family protein [Propionicimonas sp.]
MATQTELVRRIAATELMAVAPGGQIPRTADLAEAASVGYGTVQAALRSLEVEGAVALSTHGHRGTRLLRSDLRQLWLATGRAPLIGVVPLPQNREFLGLATALSVLAEQAELDAPLMFRHGGAVRLGLLEEERVDYTVMSVRAAEQCGPSVLFRALSAHTYYSVDAPVVVTRSGQQADPVRRVAIDRRSSDHMALTLAEFPEAELVSVPYLGLAEVVASGEVDAAVMWRQNLLSPVIGDARLSWSSLTRLSPLQAEPDMARAAIVWRRDDKAVPPLLDAFFPAAQLESIQSEVINGERIPQF